METRGQETIQRLPLEFRLEVMPSRQLKIKILKLGKPGVGEYQNILRQ